MTKVMGLLNCETNVGLKAASELIERTEIRKFGIKKSPHVNFGTQPAKSPFRELYLLREKKEGRQV